MLVGATSAVAAPPGLDDLRDAVADVTYPAPVQLGFTGGGSSATAVSETGIVAGYSTHVLSPTWHRRTPFRWQDGRVEELNREGRPVAVSDAGRVLVAPLSSGDYDLWEPDGTVLTLPFSSAGTGGWMNRHGVVVGTLFQRAYIVRDGEVQRLDPSRRETKVAPSHGINDAGQVVGSSWTGAQWQAFVWQDGGMRYLDTPDGAQSQALGVNAGGQVLVTHDALGPVVWEPDGTVRQLDPARAGFEPLLIDDRGAVTGTLPVESDRSLRFPAVADAHGVRRMPGLGGSVGYVRDVSPNGLVVGIAPRTRWGRYMPVVWVAELPVPLGLTPVGGTPALTGEPRDVSSGGRIVGELVHELPNGSRRTSAAVWDLVPQP